VADAATYTFSPKENLTFGKNLLSEHFLKSQLNVPTREKEEKKRKKRLSANIKSKKKIK